MVRFRFELATHEDDAALRRVLRSTPMDGRISVTFQREPSYFDGLRVEGPFRQVVVCRDSQSDEIVGFGCRSIREMHVNGRPMPIGYLSSLRVLQPYRNLGLVARGYRYFRQLHEDRRTKLYLTTIAEGNENAVAVLTSARAGLPRYHDAGKFFTFAIPISHRTSRNRTLNGSVSVRSATRDDLSRVLEFLKYEGARRQFFPDYSESDFLGSDAIFEDLDLSDLLVAIEGDQIVGTLAAWDQHAYRQTVVNKYQPPLSWARPVYNGWARLAGRPRLPTPGSSFRYLSAALPVFQNHRTDVFVALLDELLTKMADHESDHLLMGIHETDPLLPTLMSRRFVSYATRLYYACWDDELRDELDERPVYLELGTL